MTPIGSVHIIPNTPREASGYTASIYGLCQALIEAGHPTRLAVLEPLRPGFNKECVEAFPCSFGLKRFGVSPQMKRWLREKMLSGHDGIVHAHSLWRMANIYPVKAAKDTQVKFVVSPRGTLSPAALEYSALAKKAFWHLFQKSALRDATAFHATSEREYEDIRKSGYRQPVAIIPNGIDVPELIARAPKQLKRLLFLGRIHPIKGINNLLRAWREVQDHHKDWQLVIAGPDTAGYLSELRKLADDLALARCEFSGPLYGADKTEAYRQADLFVLPTHSENFGMTVAESLAAETPVIVTKGAPWEALRQKEAGWWIDIGAEPLVAALEQALDLPSSVLKKKGHHGRDWMIRDFSWQAVADNMGSFYNWLARGGDVPPFVRVD